MKPVLPRLERAEFDALAAKGTTLAVYRTPPPCRSIAP
jgi:hypothetical protein